MRLLSDNDLKIQRSAILQTKITNINPRLQVGAVDTLTVFFDDTMFQQLSIEIKDSQVGPFTNRNRIINVKCPFCRIGVNMYQSA